MSISFSGRYRLVALLFAAAVVGPVASADGGNECTMQAIRNKVLATNSTCEAAFEGIPLLSGAVCGFELVGLGEAGAIFKLGKAGSALLSAGGSLTLNAASGACDKNPNPCLCEIFKACNQAYCIGKNLIDAAQLADEASSRKDPEPLPDSPGRCACWVGCVRRSLYPDPKYGPTEFMKLQLGPAEGVAYGACRVGKGGQFPSEWGRLDDVCASLVTKNTAFTAHSDRRPTCEWRGASGSVWRGGRRVRWENPEEPKARGQAPADAPGH